jgi:hypothetical protein
LNVLNAELVVQALPDLLRIMERDRVAYSLVEVAPLDPQDMGLAVLAGQ